LEELAGQLVAQLKAEAQSDPAAGENRRQAKQRRAARDIARRVAEARRALDELRAAKATRAKTHKTDKAEKGEIRVSTTDPEARMIRFSDRAMRTGYNVQLAVEPGLRHHSGKSEQRPTE